MGFRHYLRLVLKKFWIIGLLLVVALASTFYYTQTRPVFYSAKTTIILNPKVPNALVPYASADYTYVNTMAENYSLILKSDKFAQQVIEQLNFPMDVEELKASFTSKLAPNSVFYYITATSISSEKAQKIANTVTKVFLSEGIKQTAVAGSATNELVNATIQKQGQELKNLQTEIDNLKALITTLQKETPGPKTAEEIRTLRQQLNEALGIQSRLVVSISEVESKNTELNRDSASLIDDAKLPIASDDNNLVRNLIFAAAMGLALGIGTIILLDFLDYTVRSSEDLAQLTGFTTLGVVPVVRPIPSKETTTFAADGAAPPGSESSRLNASIVTATEFKSAGSEAYRALRTNILFCDLGSGELSVPTSDTQIQPEGGMKLLLVTSAIPREGKSLTTANLAVTFAQAGNRVIIVDADLRQPTLHKLFDLSNENGFSNLILAGPAQLEATLKPTGIPNLSLITAGNPPPNPSELLTSAKAARVIEALRSAADIVIFDSPPVVLVSDAAILASRVDRVLLVFRSGSTRRDAIAKTLTKLKHVRANIMGTVLNRVQQQDDGGYYYSGYGGYTGEEQKKPRRKAKTAPRS